MQSHVWSAGRADQIMETKRGLWKQGGFTSKVCQIRSFRQPSPPQNTGGAMRRPTVRGSKSSSRSPTRCRRSRLCSCVVRPCYCKHVSWAKVLNSTLGARAHLKLTRGGIIKKMPSPASSSMHGRWNTKRAEQQDYAGGILVRALLGMVCIALLPAGTKFAAHLRACF